MCGFAGLLVQGAPWTEGRLRATARTMAEGVAARGPDGAGDWLDATAGVALAFRRLAVLDLTEAGDQPMRSHEGRFQIVFNGEIYDAAAVRARLEAEKRVTSWRGHSDTEVLLAAVEAWGLTVALERCDGMFALALWDSRERVLTLARDRLGEKPLYYGASGGTFLFGSQIAALRRFPGFDTTLSAEALRLYLRWGWIPAPHAVYACLHKLPAGALVRFRADSTSVPPPEPWWSLAAEIAAARADPWRGSLEDGAEAVAAALRSSVADRIVADVPVGTLLSGGVDSSCVVSALPSGAAVRIFTVGFDDAEHDESGYAREVAGALGRETTVLRVGPADALALVPRLPVLWDEPFADSSQIPTALVSALARREVTVALTGDGGDELFGGYPWHVAASRSTWWIRQWLGDLRSGDLRGLPRDGASRVHRNVHTAWRTPSPLRAHPGPDRTLNGSVVRAPTGLSRARRLMFLDACTYLPDDLLVKVDRAAMGVGLETRAPFLALSLIRLAWRLPDAHLFQNGTGKHVLRRVLARRLPPSLVDRPKRGFSIPLDAWLRGPLREWATALLDPERLRRQGLLDADVVDRVWREHVSGVALQGRRLWAVLMLQAWLDAPAGPGAHAEVAVA
jgi:asparagine synthase (glutamine-hydrolysing)